MNRIHPTAIIYPNVRLGDDIIIRAYAVIGSPAEKEGHLEDPGQGVAIGDGTFIGEHVTIHSGIKNVTTIGSRCRLLTKAQVGHCSILEDNVTMSCLTVAGGHSYFMRGVNLGLGAKSHQRSILGSFAMIGANSFISKKAKILPGCTYAGVPARFLKNNNLGIARFGITQGELQAEIERYYELCRLRPQA